MVGSMERLKGESTLENLLRAIDAARSRDSYARTLRARARAIGVSAEVLEVWEENLHPPGLQYPLRNRRSGRRRRSHQHVRRRWFDRWLMT